MYNVTMIQYNNKMLDIIIIEPSWSFTNNVYNLILSTPLYILFYYQNVVKFECSSPTLKTEKVMLTF